VVMNDVRWLLLAAICWLAFRGFVAACERLR
jgi:hypothetical protein